MERLVAGLVALALCAAHLLAGRLRFLEVTPRSRWLSFAGGASVAYVFVHIFPELSRAQADLHHVGRGLLPFLEHHVYLVALVGFAISYGLETVALRFGGGRRTRGFDPQPRPRDTPTGVFWVHIGSFALYNALIGYLLLHREDRGIDGLLLFGLAMGLHFVVNDHGLRAHHQRAYDRKGRWVLAAGIALGWAVGAATHLPPQAVAVLFALLAGGVVLNVIKEELPAEREGRFWAFAVGMIVYTAVLLAVPTKPAVEAERPAAAEAGDVDAEQER